MWLAVSLTWVAFGAPSAVAQKLPSEFVAAYGEALDAMQQVYSQGTIQGTLESAFPPSGRSINRRFTLRLMGQTSRLDASVVSQAGMNAKVGGTDILLAMPGASMQAYRNSNGEVANQPFAEDGYSVANAGIKGLCNISFPYTMGGQANILQMLHSGNVKIASFKKGKRDGEPMIQIKYSQLVDPEGRQGPWNCSLLLAPLQGYALRSYTRTAGTAGRQVTFSGSLSYTLTPNNVPLLQQLDRIERHGSTVVERQSISVSRFSLEPPDGYIFSADGF
jgi:hypothetical protein